MNKTRQTRLKREYQKLSQDGQPPGIMIELCDDDFLSSWKVTMEGPPDSPYSGGIFNLIMNIPQKYPHSPPKVQFITKIFHPNIFEDGRICLDILSNTQWSPIINFSQLFLSIQSLLTDPRPEDAANISAGNLCINNNEAYCEKVREFVKMYASKETEKKEKNSNVK